MTGRIECRIFAVSCLLSRIGCPTEVRTPMGYRLTTDSEDAVRGGFIKHVLAENEGFCLLWVQTEEVTREHIEIAYKGLAE